MVTAQWQRHIHTLMCYKHRVGKHDNGSVLTAGLMVLAVCPIPVEAVDAYDRLHMLEGGHKVCLLSGAKPKLHSNLVRSWPIIT